VGELCLLIGCRDAGEEHSGDAAQFERFHDVRRAGLVVAVVGKEWTAGHEVAVPVATAMPKAPSTIASVVPCTASLPVRNASAALLSSSIAVSYRPGSAISTASGVRLATTILSPAAIASTFEGLELTASRNGLPESDASACAAKKAGRKPSASSTPNDPVRAPRVRCVSPASATEAAYPIIQAAANRPFWRGSSAVIVTRRVAPGLPASFAP